MFDASTALALSREILTKEPFAMAPKSKVKRDFIKRPELANTVVFQAVIPAEYCKEANATSRKGFAGKNWAHADLKEKLWAALKEQAEPWLKYRWAWPLCLETGRPQVVAIKFSSHPNDEGSNPAKAAIDMLTCHRLLDAKEGKYTKHRLGVIKDDRRSEVEQLHWWEFLPKKHHAFVLVEVRI